MTKMTLREAITDAMRVEMRLDPMLFYWEKM